MLSRECRHIMSILHLNVTSPRIPDIAPLASPAVAEPPGLALARHSGHADGDPVNAVCPYLHYVVEFARLFFPRPAAIFGLQQAIRAAYDTALPFGIEGNRIESPIALQLRIIALLPRDAAVRGFQNDATHCKTMFALGVKEHLPQVDPRHVLHLAPG